MENYIRKLFLNKIKPDLTPEESRALKATKRRRRARGVPRLSVVLIYTGVFLLILAVTAIGYRSASSTPTASSTVIATSSVTQTTVDDIVAVNLAASLAQTANLPISANVSNLAVSTEIKSQLAQANDTIISKPQILSTVGDNRTVTSYTVAAGENASTIAAKFGISADTVKWANNLTSDYVAPGKVLIVLPVNGVYYTVKSGDTIDSIATKYKTDAARIIAFNDLELSGLVVGEKIILPDGVLPNVERPGYVAPRPAFSFAVGGWGGSVQFLYWNTQRTTPGNLHAWGNCTWYVWEKRYSMGGSWVLPSRPLGNAAEWAWTLGNAGYRVDRTPSYGAIVQNGGGAGHVAIVESVSANGDVIITEMNYGGWYNGVSRRTIPAASAGNYNYIH